MKSVDRQPTIRSFVAAPRRDDAGSRGRDLRRAMEEGSCGSAVEALVSWRASQLNAAVVDRGVAWVERMTRVVREVLEGSSARTLVFLAEFVECFSSYHQSQLNYRSCDYQANLSMAMRMRVRHDCGHSCCSHPWDSGTWDRAVEAADFDAAVARAALAADNESWTNSIADRIASHSLTFLPSGTSSDDTLCMPFDFSYWLRTHYCSCIPILMTDCCMIDQKRTARREKMFFIKIFICT